MLTVDDLQRAKDGKKAHKQQLMRNVRMDHEIYLTPDTLETFMSTQVQDYATPPSKITHATSTKRKP